MSTHTVYTKDKNVRVSFRLDGKLSEWILERSESLGVSPSAFLRNLAYQSFYTETALARVGMGTAQNRKVADHADNETLQHD